MTSKREEDSVAGGHQAEAFLPRGQGFDVTRALFYERPLEDPGYLEVWCYTDRLSYRPGEVVHIHASTTAQEFSIEIVRDGARPHVVQRIERVRAPCTPLRPDFYERGCDWPVALEWPVSPDLPSGFYMIIARARNAAGQLREQEHGFFVLPTGERRGELLLIAATSTWTAYNDWGGANNYQAAHAPAGFGFAPRLTIHRPFARGLIWTPEGAPRKPHDFPIPVHSIPRYPTIEFAYARGFSKWYANAGWATYERPFAVWAEQQGYRLDYATQHDLHFTPEILDDYRCVVLVGHDEYWSREMREAIDAFVERGGHVARFAANCAWQIRLEDGGATQVCYKSRAHEADPLASIDMTRATSLWEDPKINWPGARTFGLNATAGLYAHVGNLVPRGTGGFTVYRPEHWALGGTDLCYGDVFGGDARILGYEVDGLDYTVRQGLPYATFSDGAPSSVEILAMGLACNNEIMRGYRGEVSYYGDISATLATVRYGSADGALRAAGARGAGMIVTFTKGAGSVFSAGSCEWVAGLKRGDVFTQAITRNVLDRFARMRFR